MQIKLIPEIEPNPRGTYTILAVCGNFYVKRVKDVHNYYYRLEKQSNSYFIDILQISSELESVFSQNLKSLTNDTVYSICRNKTEMYERIKYLTFYTWVISVYKMNALYTITENLIRISKDLKVNKYTKQLETMQKDFFVSRSYYTKEANTMKILMPVQTKYKKAI